MILRPTSSTQQRLYPRGTTLADVPPNFRGVSYVEWLFSALADVPRPATAPLNDKPIATGRTDYGMAGVRGSTRRVNERPATQPPATQAGLLG